MNLKRTLIRSAAVVSTFAPVAAFAQSASTVPTAASLFGSTDMTQSYVAVGIIAAPVLITAVAFSVLMNLRRGAKMAK